MASEYHQETNYRKSAQTQSFKSSTWDAKTKFSIKFKELTEPQLVTSTKSRSFVVIFIIICWNTKATGIQVPLTWANNKKLKKLSDQGWLTGWFKSTITSNFCLRLCSLLLMWSIDISVALRFRKEMCSLLEFLPFWSLPNTRRSTHQF
jgi:hypothetical protein